jgi:hypothetical protein
MPAEFISPGYITEQTMQTINCNIGIWKDEAKIKDVDDSKLLVIVSALLDEGDPATESRHVLVFDHTPGCDRTKEAKDVMERVLRTAH